jgi:NADP-dependent 3-hydroxy acid dehydrogenase YdfG
MTTKTRNLLIIGATSAIAEATARLWASTGSRLYLVARNAAKLEAVAADLRVRGAQVETALLEVNDLAAHEAVIEAAFRALGQIDVVLIAHGDLPDQTQCERSLDATLHALNTNAVSTVSLLTLVANRLQAQGSGVIAVIGSVAGDRGRKSNYVYGSCKALVATFTEGLAGRMHKFGVGVINIKPGFVDTPMTAHIAKKGLLWAQPSQIAALIDRRVAAGRSGSFYAPRFWGLIMLVIRLLPAPILYRLNI